VFIFIFLNLKDFSFKNIFSVFGLVMSYDWPKFCANFHINVKSQIFLSLIHYFWGNFFAQILISFSHHISTQNLVQ
jgi:hypothetical protein